MMQARGLLLVVVLGAACSLGSSGDAGAATQPHQCSREESRTATSILDEYLLPLLAKMNYTLSPQCRLRADLQRYYEHERHKREVRKGQWKCMYCNKAFRSESYLDRHLDNRHQDKIPANATNCLGDHCDVLHCRHHLGEIDHQRTHCKASKVDQLRHQCEEIAHNCFPSEAGELAANLNGFFQEQFCDSHTCDRNRRIFPKGSLYEAGTNWAYVTLVGVVLIVLGIFYCSVWQHGRELAAGRGDLRRMPKNKGFFASFAPKSKAY